MDSLLRNRQSRRVTGGYMELRARPGCHMDVIPHGTAYHTNDMERRALLSLHEAVNHCEDSDNQAFFLPNPDDLDRYLERIDQIMKNPKMSRLIIGYSEMNVNMYFFIRLFVQSLEKAHNFVEHAIKSSEAADKNDQPPEVKRTMRYTKTLDELRQYFFVGGTYDFESVYQKQLSLLRELQNQKVEHEKKLQSVKTWRNVGCIISVSALKASPRISVAMTAAALIPLRSMRQWFDSMLKDYRDALKAEMKLIDIMLVWTSFAGTNLDNIRISVKRLEDNRILLLDYDKFVFKDEDPLRLDIVEMGKKMREFMKSIKDLIQQADRCINDIARAGSAVYHQIILTN